MNDDWNAFIDKEGARRTSDAAIKTIMWLATFFSRLRIVARCWFDRATSCTWFLWARTALNILTWLMNVVRTARERTAAMTRNIRKRFEDKINSVVTTNSVTLTPTSTALVNAPVPKQEKKVVKNKFLWNKSDNRFSFKLCPLNIIIWNKKGGAHCSLKSTDALKMPLFGRTHSQ